MDKDSFSDASDEKFGDCQAPEQCEGLSIQAACSEVIQKMYSLGFKLDTFLDALCYGDETCRSPADLKTARRHLRTSPLLPGILDQLHTVPRTKSKGKQAVGAVEPLENWALATAERIYRQELLDFASRMKCDVEEIVNEESLSNLTFRSILDEVK